MQLELLTIGDELLDGVITDTNSAWLCDSIQEIGGQVSASSTVRDDLPKLIAAFTEIAARADVCICTGGLGPTPDDITVDALSVASDSPLRHDERVWEDILDLFGDRTPTTNNRRQARVPERGTALRSSVGTAPALRIKIGQCTIFALPGVSREMKWHFGEYVRPFLEDTFPTTTHSRTLRFAGIGESSLAQRVGDLQLPEEVDVLYRTHLPENHIRLRAPNASALATAADAIIQVAARAYLGDTAVSLEEATLAACRRHGLTMGTAESCTGGLVGATLTQAAGASDVYVGSVVSYSNRLKSTLLGVSEDTLRHHGAVSEETVRSMASGAQSTLECDIAVSITGIAGPDGGTPEKPVGTVWFGWKGPGLEETMCRHFRGDRERIRRLAMGCALDRIRRHYGES